ncbi:MAG: Uma2 family endonuclease [Gloeomargarita sp. SKYG116]|nr:Uma2 family endonuclease [Gloeomargarita sp. SKYG116]MCS7293742.1 Uma2 family endonuclease [Gloeomargarita sp. SKYB120]MDW8179308.1 Uma2 family endonuclease [Gloeomargarita sp. SKYBB_i_bin120]MDW8400730.1 Uma2 family endonuclease [Gloeomargarita sp. SKYGB_i_bin116]
MVTLQLHQLEIPPGQRLVIRGLDWTDFDAILTELGEKRGSRIAYVDGVLEIRMPLPKHERLKSILSDIVKLLLEELGIDCECFGSSTFKNQKMDCGVEPDDCFYIQNYRQVIGKDRFDLTIDPPPDLVLEVDVTSKTQLEAYIRLGVPELWVYADGELQIYLLRNGVYQPVGESPISPGLPVKVWVQDVLNNSAQMGRSQALRTLRQTIRQHLAQTD